MTADCIIRLDFSTHKISFFSNCFYNKRQNFIFSLPFNLINCVSSLADDVHLDVEMPFVGCVLYMILLQVYVMSCFGFFLSCLGFCLQVLGLFLLNSFLPCFSLSRR